jgi:hypothetical protein
MGMGQRQGMGQQGMAMQGQAGQQANAEFQMLAGQQIQYLQSLAYISTDQQLRTALRNENAYVRMAAAEEINRRRSTFSYSGQ